MRFIDLDLVLSRPGAGEAIAHAEELAAEVERAPPESRGELIARNRQAWVAFRPLLQAAFGMKCWYTESTNSGTDDDIDHFRPKGRIAERPDHGGYWWEAFNWRNLRLSCHRANRARINPESGDSHGKADHFPLIHEERRWFWSEPCREDPALLDPTDPGDPPLLTFAVDGTVAVAPFYAKDRTAAARVKASRIYLHLEWPAFVEDRQAVYAQVLGAVLEGDRAQRAFLQEATGSREQLKSVSERLIRMAVERAPYSRAAIAYIMVFRDRDWVRRLVVPNIAAALEQ